MRTACYIAHPLSAPTREGVEANRANASRWFAWSERLGFVPMAGWITLTGGLDETPENRARGLEYDKAQLERCDAMWLVGGRISSGMQIEREHAIACGIPVRDLTALGVSPPDPEWVDVASMVGLPGTSVPSLPDERAALYANLTATQDRCNELLEENRRMRWRQDVVARWCASTFGPDNLRNVPERSLRFLEEAIELAQATGVVSETAHQLIDYVFARKPGLASQEIGGVMVTLYALATAIRARVDFEADQEIERIQKPEVIERCRARQSEKRAVLGEAG